MDPKVFKNPEAFNPGRFLTPQDVLATLFSNRACIGDKIAKLTLFMFLFGLLQKYELLPEDKGKLPPLTRGYQLVSLPKDFKMRFVPRK
nr:hypothetical protein BaRGS_022932 [Batillaria attramentaria]